ncbi:MAG: M48 family metalloprotease [Rickettsiales bacterium]|nr:M48 family metalloprotease [Rickettsiales bacterium]
MFIKNKKIISKFLTCLIIILLSFNASSSTQNAISLIRDDETETFLREVTTPIFRSIGLDENSVEIVIINDPSINAFVAGGQKVFIHTGLIMESDDLASLLGVLAHEAGHIKGAHLIQKSRNFEDINLGMIAGYVLGLGSVIAGAPAEAGLAISSAGQNIATRRALSYSRDYENAADAVALDVMREINITPLGLVKILRKLTAKQRIAGDIVDQYMLTHPVSEDRVNYILNYVKANPEVDKKTPDAQEAKFKRIRGKFYGFLANPKRTRGLYSRKATSDGYYALAVAYHKEARFDESQAYLNKLISQNPSDPYYQELKGQFLFEMGKIKEASKQYQKVTEMLPNSNLIKLKYANSLMAEGGKPSLLEAITILKTITARETKNIGAINRLGIAYGKLGMLDNSYLYLAESAILAKDKNNSKFYLSKAEQLVDKSSQNYLKFNELKKELGRLLEN